MEPYSKLITVILCFTSFCIGLSEVAYVHASKSFVWKIDTKQLDLFINANNGEFVKSKMMEHNGLQFQLGFFSNGRVKHQNNQFVAHLCINNLSTKKNSITSVFVNWNLFIHEINFSKIVKRRHHEDTAKCRGFILLNNKQIMRPLTKMYANKKNKLSSISVSITINIINTFNIDAIINNDVSKYSKQLRRYNEFEWVVNNADTLNQMKLAQHQETYISNLFDDFWFVSLTPNGYHEGSINSFDLFLHIVSLPNGLNKIHLKCTFNINELNIIHQFQAQWTNKDKGWGYPSKKFSFDLFSKTQNLKQLTITLECEILNLYNTKNREIKLSNHWRYFSIKNNRKKNNYYNVPSRNTSIVKMDDYDDHDDDDSYCTVTNDGNNIALDEDIQNIYEMLMDLSYGINLLEHQLFLSIGMFAVNLIVTFFIFISVFGVLICGLF